MNMNPIPHLSGDLMAPTLPVILIIDDDPANLSLMVDNLEKHGLTSMIARDGESGLQRAQQGQPDLILLDVMMPDPNGFETCRRLKANSATAEIPVIFMTALTETENKVKGFELGSVDYLTKPIQIEEALARIKTHLTLRQLQKRLTLQNQQLQQEIAERNQVETNLQQAHAQLQQAHAELELRVAQRTAQLAEANANLAKTEARYRTLFEQSPDAIIIVDPETGQPLEFNQGTLNLLGYSIEEMGQLPLTSYQPIGNRISLEQGLHQNLTEFETKIHTKTGEIKDVLVKTQQLDLADKKALYLILRDITQHKRLEKQFLQAQRMEAVGRLTGGVAHDFNNILTVIQISCAFMLNELKPGQPLRADVEQIQQAAERAATLTRQLLAFSRQQVLQPQELNLNLAVTNMEKMLRRIVSEDIELTTALQPELGLVKADPGQIEQVILNLAINARDAMPHGGKLTLETANIYLDQSYAQEHLNVIPGPYIMLAVSDTGLGIEADTLPHIFEPFFTTKANEQGTGLGLATVYGIVTQSNGHIGCYSELQKGTTFRVYLPQINAAETLTQPEVVVDKPYQGTETILLVEDEVTVRIVTSRTLQQAGYTVLTAADGPQALQISAAYKNPIHLLVTDVILPGKMNGANLAQTLSALYPGLKTLYMSGYTDNAIILNGMVTPGLAFLPKPFLPQELLRKAREVLDKTGL